MVLASLARYQTRHGAGRSIPYLGHLPTDLIGRSILAFVYAPDVHVVRQAHVDYANVLDSPANGPIAARAAETYGQDL
ncbi:hypothetical protein COOONC_24855 [Cooperia oncophora]